MKVFRGERLLPITSSEFSLEAHGSTVVESNAVLTDEILTSMTITNYLIIFYIVILGSVETVEKVCFFFFNHHFTNY